MKKRISAFAVTLLIIFSFSFSTFANDEIEYYDEYDDYYEFEQDYYDTVVFPEEDKNEQWYSALSPVPPIIGIIAGAATIFVLYRRQRAAQSYLSERPHSFAPDIKHTVSQNKNTL